MEFTISFKNSPTINKSIAYSNGGGVTHSLYFLVRPDKFPLLLNKEILLIQFSKDAGFNKDSYFIKKYKRIESDKKVLHLTNFNNKNKISLFKEVEVKKQNRRRISFRELTPFKKDVKVDITDSLLVKRSEEFNKIDLFKQLSVRNTSDFIGINVNAIKKIKAAGRKIHLSIGESIRKNDAYKISYNKLVRVGIENSKMYTSSSFYTLSRHKHKLLINRDMSLDKGLFNKLLINKIKVAKIETGAVEINKYYTPLNYEIKEFIKIPHPLFVNEEVAKFNLSASQIFLKPTDKKLKKDYILSFCSDEDGKLSIDYKPTLAKTIDKSLKAYNILLSLSSYNKKLKKYESEILANLITGSMFIKDVSSFASIYNNKLNFNAESLKAKLEQKGVLFNKDNCRLKIKDNVGSINNISFVGRHILNININKENLFMFKPNPNLSRSYKDYNSLYRPKDELRYKGNGAFVGEYGKKVETNDMYFKGISKEDKGVLFNYNLICLDRPKPKMYILEGHLDLLTEKTFGINNDIYRVKINNKQTSVLQNYQINIKKYNKELNLKNSLFVKRHDELPGMYINKDSYSISINYKSIFIHDSVNSLTKNNKNLRLDERYFGFAKNKKDTMINNDYLINFTKGRKNGNLEYDFITVNKGMKKSGMLYVNTFISKGKKDVAYSYYNGFISKNRKSSRLYQHDETWFSKSSKDIGIMENFAFINKQGKPTGEISSLLLVSKYGEPVYTKHGDLKCLTKNPRNTFRISENFFASKYSKSAVFSNKLYQLSQKSKSIFNIKRDIFVSKNYFKIDTFKQPFLISTGYFEINKIKEFLVGTDSKPISLDNNVIYIDIDNRSTRKEESLKYSGFVGKTFGDIGMSGYEFIFKTRYDITKNKDAFLYKESRNIISDFESIFTKVISYDGSDKPSLSPSGIIDELILPHKDFKYSDYLRKLINEEGVINFAYVKSFNSETGEYTIKLPIDHPIKIYADVAREYIDVDVSVLELVIYMIREIWKEKMFKYIAMSAQESLTDILKELEKKIKNSYDLKRRQLKEAFRCLQLFRWYAEMAILNNCDYVLSFDSKNIKVNFLEKSLNEFVNILELENMEISDNYIIEPIDSSIPCKLMFSNTQKNPGPPLNITFKLYNINTDSSISIIDEDGVVEHVYSAGIHDITLELKDKAELAFIPSGGIQSIGIANLEASNYSSSSMKISYKGVFGETNKVMQDLLDRLLVAGEVTAAIKEELKDVSPVTIAIDTLLKYFDLHHEGKVKGKRLIAKK